jgi:Tfp pilus assembly protein PilF
MNVVKEVEYIRASHWQEMAASRLLAVLRKDTMRVPILFALVLFLAGATHAGASERLELLISRGLLEHHDGHYDRALAAFDEAVQVSPSDPYARYYRGVTYGRLGELDRSITDLQVALALRPDFPEAALELGAALVKRESYEGRPRLEQARRDPALDARASFFLGVAELHAGQTAAARRDFERAAASGQVDPAAVYYGGLVEFRDRQWRPAEERFERVQTTSPDTEMGREAGRFLKRLRPYRLYGSVALEYDSNVALAPSNDVVKSAVGVSDQSDGRVTLVAGGTYVPWRNDRGSLTLGYEFSQTLQFELNEFNLQDHRPSAELSWDFGPVQVGVLGTYDYYFLQTDSFLQEGAGFPWLVIPEDRIGRAEVFFRARYQDFLKRPFQDVRNSLNYSPGFRQFFYLDAPEDYVFIGYRFDREDALESVGDPFAYNGNEVEAGIGWQLPQDVGIEASFAYRNEDYDSASDGRGDNEYLAIVAVRKQLTEHLRVSGVYYGDYNDSNKPVFQYNRSVGSLMLEVRF